VNWIIEASTPRFQYPKGLSDMLADTNFATAPFTGPSHRVYKLERDCLPGPMRRLDELLRLA
jgi:hypothetical protein